MLKRLSPLALGLALLISSSPCQAGGSISAGFSEDSGFVSYAHEISRDETSRATLGGRFLRNTDENTTLGSVGIAVLANPGLLDGLELGGGFQAYGASHGNDDLAGGAVGALASYFPPALQGLGVSGSLYYAPEIFCAMDAEEIMESTVRLSYRIQQRTELYLAYNNIRVEVENRGKKSLDESVSFGVGISF